MSPARDERRQAVLGCLACELCNGTGDRENDLKRIVPCWQCRGSGWHTAVTR